MSIFGAMATAVLGLNAQSRSLGHISDNIANAQTTGYKRVDTSFQTLVLQSNSRLHMPGGAIAAPRFTNNIQGNLSQVQSNTSLALQGQGFFAVTPTEPPIGTSTVSQYYTRSGDFELSEDRYLVNSAGYALNGFSIDPNTLAEGTALEPIQISSLGDNPVVTSGIDLRANLPSAPDPDRPLADTPIQIYDAQGSTRTINLRWRQQSSGEWRLFVDAPESTISPVEGTFPGYPTSAVAGPVMQGQAPRAQVDTHTFSGPNIKIGDIYRVTVRGTPFELTITSANISAITNFNGVASALADRINSAVPPVGVTASTEPGGKLVLSATTAGSAFASTAAVDNATPLTNTVGSPFLQQTATSTLPQISSLSFSGPSIDVGDRFTVVGPDTVTGTRVYTLTVTPANIESLGDINGIVQRLADTINANTNSPITASASGGLLSMTSKSFGTTFTAPAASISNGSLTPNATAKVTMPTNIAGVRQRQTISITGTMGDIGAIYSVNVKSPTSFVGTVDTSGTGTQPATSTQPQISTVSFAGPNISVGDEYRFDVDGTTYSMLVTNDNIDEYNDINGVILALRDKINNDGGSSVTATASGNVLTLTGKNVDQDFELDPGNVPTAFNRTVEYRTTGDETSLDDITTRLATLVNALGVPVTASAVGGVLTVSSTTDGGQFVATPTSSTGETPAHIGLSFGGTDPITGVISPPGTLTRIDTARVGSGTSTTPVRREAGSPATISFRVNYGFGPQEVTLNLGHFQESDGLTNFDGDAVTVSSIQQNGSPRGNFKDVEIDESGYVVVNYDNGMSRQMARIPVVMFNNANGLQRVTGGVFGQTMDSGSPLPKQANIEGAGKIVVNSLENSNVDIADEFTKLIITQRTYSANTKIVTTSDEMLQEIISLKR